MEAGTSMVRESRQDSTVVTLPPDLLAEAQRIASQEKWTISQTVIFLAKRGVVSQKKAEENLERSYARFMADPKNAEAGDDLITSIFGPDAVAKD
jgi:hypothetical protein